MFKQGDKVVCVEDIGVSKFIEKSTVYTIQQVYAQNCLVRLEELPGLGFSISRFRLVDSPELTTMDFW